MNERDDPSRPEQPTPPDRRGDVVERGEHLRRPTQPGQRDAFVAGPTGPAPLASELRGDPGAEGDRGAEGGIAAGAVGGAAVGGPIGAVVGGAVGAVIGSTADADSDLDDPGRTAESEQQDASVQ